jgi:hypothetical protein
VGHRGEPPSQVIVVAEDRPGQRCRVRAQPGAAATRARALTSQRPLAVVEQQLAAAIPSPGRHPHTEY